MARAEREPITEGSWDGAPRGVDPVVVSGEIRPPPHEVFRLH